jgi:hypothetical protein
MRVLTAPAFAAAKLAAWVDRQTPRDLYDLWALSEAGHIDSRAASLFGRFGPFTNPAQARIDRVPTQAEWDSALSHQCIPRVSPADAARAVDAAWIAATS